jgi:hypothetical protein
VRTRALVVRGSNWSWARLNQLQCKAWHRTASLSMPGPILAAGMRCRYRLQPGAGGAAPLQQHCNMPFVMYSVAYLTLLEGLKVVL